MEYFILIRFIAALCCAFVLLSVASPAEARHRRHRGLPWCGIYLGKHLGMPSRHLWIARNWARKGVAAGGPGVGVVVVWRHHVGVITGQASNGMWLVHSEGLMIAVCPHPNPRFLSGGREIWCPTCEGRWFKCELIVPGRSEYAPAPEPKP